MSWVRGHNGVYLLAALHQPYSLIIWDTAAKTKLWKKTYTENLLSFSIDPFNNSRLACKPAEPFWLIFTTFNPTIFFQFCVKIAFYLWTTSPFPKLLQATEEDSTSAKV